MRIQLTLTALVLLALTSEDTSSSGLGPYEANVTRATKGPARMLTPEIPLRGFSTQASDCQLIQYDDNVPWYFWQSPDEFGDTMQFVRFSPDSACTLKTVGFFLYEAATIGNPGVRVSIYSAVGSYPGTIITFIDVPNANLVYMPSLNVVDFSNQHVVLNEDFCVVIQRVGSVSDTLALLSDSGSTNGRSGEFYAVSDSWELIKEGWGIDVDFLIRATVCYSTSGSPCATLCGDVNGNGAVTSADIIYLSGYIFRAGATPILPACADADSYAGIDAADIIVLINYVFMGGPGPSCPPSNPEYDPAVSGSDLIRIDSARIASNADTSFSLLVSLESSQPIAALTIPLSFSGHSGLKFDTTIITAGNMGITYEGLGLSPDWVLKYSLVNQTNKTIMLGFVSFSGGLPASSGPLARIHFRQTGPPSEEITRLDSTYLPPHNHLTLTTRDAVNWTPQFSAGRIRTNPAGDVDVSWNISTIDIIALVNFVFKGKPLVVPPCAADLNGDSVANLADIIYLVNHVFKSGPSPSWGC